MALDFIADIILFVHVIWVFFIVGCVPLIFLGKIFYWKWVHNSWLRNIHLMMMVIVTGESFLAITCPLTDLENFLRYENGQGGYTGTFVGEWLGRLIFYDFEPQVFLIAYGLFFLLIVLLYFWVPPNCLRKK